MKKWIVIAVVVVLAGGAALAAANWGWPGGEQSTAKSTPEPTAKPSPTVSADGKVVPLRSAELTLPTSGVVAEVLVKEGERVQAGQALIRLEGSRQQAALAQAEAGLRRAEANLAQVKAGAREQEVAAARAAVDAAKAQLARVQTGARSDEVAAAESAVKAAEAGVAAAEAALKRLLQGPEESELVAAKAELASAEAALKQAQAEYDKVAWAPDVAARPEALRLEQATIAYNAAKARLDLLQRQPSAAAVDAARAEVQRAKAQLQQAQATLAKVKSGAQAADIQAAEAGVRQAQAQLELALAGARPETVAAAEAEVANARAAVEQARVALADIELKAPFAGTVAAIAVAPGELATPNRPLVHLADFSAWQIETTDLSELDAPRVREGDPARITFDAIPDLELTGKVVRIKPLGEARQGDITYTAVIALDRQDERLRWNMTAIVAVEPRS